MSESSGFGARFAGNDTQLSLSFGVYIKPSASEMSLGSSRLPAFAVRLTGSNKGDEDRALFAVLFSNTILQHYAMF